MATAKLYAYLQPDAMWLATKKIGSLARQPCEKLDTYLAKHPGFTRKKILLSGSLTKGLS